VKKLQKKFTNGVVRKKKVSSFAPAFGDSSFGDELSVFGERKKIFSKKLAEIKILITFAARFEREVGF
jgi:deoxyhypusine synthase